MTTSTSSTTDLPLDLRCSGPVSDQDADYARSKVLAALRHASEPVLFARARLTMLADPALVRPAVAQVNVDLNGRLIRCQVDRPTMREAIDALHDRLLSRLQRAARHWEAIRGSRGPEHFPRAVDERRMVRHKTFTPSGTTVDEAALDMELLDYGFQLFTESGSGQVSVLYRGDDGYRLAQVVPHPELVTQGAIPVTVSGHTPPLLTEQEAVDRLEQTGWPFVFFQDGPSGRGRLLYHRYDGDYGLITPAD